MHNRSPLWPRVSGSNHLLCGASAPRRATVVNTSGYPWNLSRKRMLGKCCQWITQISTKPRTNPKGQYLCIPAKNHVRLWNTFVSFIWRCETCLCCSLFLMTHVSAFVFAALDLTLIYCLFSNSATFLFILSFSFLGLNLETEYCSVHLEVTSPPPLSCHTHT